MQNNFEKHDFMGNLNRLRETVYSLGVAPVEKISDDFVKSMKGRDSKLKIMSKDKENTASA